MIFSGIRRPVSAPVAQCIGAEGLQSLAAQVKAQLQRRGDSLLIPGVGIVDGFSSGTYSDSAGATPAVLDDFLGRWVDAGAGGLAFTQATTPNKPLLTKRVNVLTRTKALSHSDWTKRGTLSVTDGIAGPSGGNDASRISGIQAVSVADIFSAAYSTTGTAFPGESLRLAFKVRRVSATGIIYFAHPGSPSFGSLNVDLSKMAEGEWVTVPSSHPAVTQTTAFTATALGQAGVIITATGGPASIDLWGLDLRLSAFSVSLPKNQWVDTSTNYDTAGFPYQVRFGASQTLSTSIPAGMGYADTTIISALPGGQVTLIGQNLSGVTHTIGTNLDLLCRIYAFNGSSLTAAELALYQQYMSSKAVA